MAGDPLTAAGATGLDPAAREAVDGWLAAAARLPGPARSPPPSKPAGSRLRWCAPGHWLAWPGAASHLARHAQVRLPTGP